MAITRRKFLGMTAVTGASLMLPWRFGVQEAFAAQAISPILSKWAQNLRGLTALGDPNGIPVAAGVPDPVFTNTVMYDITVGQFTDTLHPAMGPTTLWGYWDSSAATPVKRHLGGLILATRGTATRIRMTNMLPGTHLFPNDLTVQTILGGGLSSARADRTAVHLHGGYIPWISDGGPFDWFTNPANAGGNETGMSFINGKGGVLDNIPGKPMNTLGGQADYFYPNDQSTRLMWYHDHAYGITRLNAYAGVATGYPIIDPAQEAALGTMVPPITSLIPLVFQDKKFVNGLTIGVQDPTWTGLTTTGSLWYAHIYDPREFKLMTKPPYLPPPVPSAIPEFFGDTMLCNGTVQPIVNVQRKRYRFWALNACNARFLNINLLKVPTGAVEITTDKNTLMPVAGTLAGPNMIQIGTEGGYLTAPVTHTNNKFFNPVTFTGNMLIGCAERSDFIIDFSNAAIGDEFMMYNDAPGPFPAGPATTDYFIGNNRNPAMAGVLPGQTIDTRNILKFRVIGNPATPDTQPAFSFPPGFPRDPFLVDYALADPLTGVLPEPTVVNFRRDLTLNEDFDAYGRLRQLVGTTLPAPPAPGAPKNAPVTYGLEYGAAPTETPVAGDVEVWRIFNLTADTHPMHFHLVDVQILKREKFTLTKGQFLVTPLTARGPEPDERGWKETCKMHPGEVITVCMKFDMPAVPFNVPVSPRTGNNEYVWHCHILEHEEHDMMRPLIVSGVNPVGAYAVVPASQTVTAPPVGAPSAAVAKYAINFGIKPVTIAYDSVAFPALIVLQTVQGFEVTVPQGTTTLGTVTFTVTDANGRVATVSLVIQ